MLVTHPRRLGIALVALSLCASQPAFADDRAACVAAFEQSQRLRADGKLISARAALRTCAAESCPASIATMCLGWLSDVERTLPTVIVSARMQDGADVVDVRVSIDDTIVQTRATGMPIEIDPGRHTIRFEASSGQTATEEVVINAGERNRIVRATFAPREVPPPPPPPPSSERPLTLPVALGSLGVVLGITGSVLAVGANSDLSALHDGCGATRSCAQSDVDSTHTRMLVGDLLIGAGVVSLAAAAYFLFR
jgi:hypothetical protein